MNNRSNQHSQHNIFVFNFEILISSIFILFLFLCIIRLIENLMADMPGDNNSPVQSKSTPDHKGQSQCVCTHQFTVCVEKINTALIQNQEEA